MSTPMKGTMQDFPLTLPMIFRRMMRFAPDKMVVTAGPGGPWRHPWGQIGERTLRLCNALRKLGVQEGDHVGTFAWNTHRHLEVYFAVPCMGSVLHPLNIRLFPEQVAYIANHAEDKVVFVDASLTKVLAPIKDQLRTVKHFVVMHDTDDVDPEFADCPNYEDLIAAEDADFTFPEIDERSAASMCYTSGTTGNPKGVVYEHRSMMLHTMAAMMVDALAICERDTVLPVVPMFHVGCWSLPYACAYSGANLVLPGSQMGQPQVIAELIQQEKVTLAGGVPTIWVGIEPLLDQYDFSSLRAILSGGSAVPEGLIRRFAAKGVPIVHAWGMTEMSPIGSIFRLRSDVADASDDERFALNARQGIAVPGVEMRITDEEGHELPWDGEAVGEIEVRGPWIIEQYYNPDDDSNAAKFRDGWLRTGDVACIDRRGYIKITDRVKDLVKSGGEWISTVELEGLLMAHPSVLEAAVVAVPHPKWDERPLALVVKRPDKDVTHDELIEFLATKVAKWWLPDAIEFVPDIPKTSVGKFDKKVIREKYRDYSLPTA